MASFIDGRWQRQEKRVESPHQGFSATTGICVKKAMMLHAMETAGARTKCQKMIVNMQRKRKDNHCEPLGTNKLVKKKKWSDTMQECQNTQISENRSTDAAKPGHSVFVPKTADHHSLVKALKDSWEVDSGFSEASPPASGRSSPCLSSCPTTVVALDCEMVGTGPGGCCSELARCSILDYHGNVLYDKYVQPCQPVTDYRTPWSGIQRRHLSNATPFVQAREEVRSASRYYLHLLFDSHVPCHSFLNTLYTMNTSEIVVWSLFCRSWAYLRAKWSWAIPSTTTLMQWTYSTHVTWSGTRALHVSSAGWPVSPENAALRSKFWPVSC